MYRDDQRTVITLDAGGTNFVFSAIKSNKFVVEPISLPSRSEDLDACLSQLVEGFSQVIEQFSELPVAISFAFPGPADYVNGVICGYLPNFPSFREGVALKAFLEEKFGLPVFINNDGDLFAYGEALAGRLPEINQHIAQAGGGKAYKSLIGYTFGTGFGVGHVYDNVLHLGDNGCVETFCLRHKLNPDIIVEEGVSIRAIKRVYAELSGTNNPLLEPKDIFDIAEGLREGDSYAAKAAFHRFGEIAADAIAPAVSLLDGIVVIGGGITAANKYIMPALLSELRSSLKTLSGDEVQRIQSRIYNIDDNQELNDFISSSHKSIKVYGSDKYVTYQAEKRVGITTSTLGASKAISLGAYNYALSQIDK